MKCFGCWDFILNGCLLLTQSLQEEVYQFIAPCSWLPGFFLPGVKIKIKMTTSTITFYLEDNILLFLNPKCELWRCALTNWFQSLLPSWLCAQWARHTIPAHDCPWASPQHCLGPQSQPAAASGFCPAPKPPGCPHPPWVSAPVRVARALSALPLSPCSARLLSAALQTNTKTYLLARDTSDSTWSSLTKNSIIMTKLQQKLAR